MRWWWPQEKEEYIYLNFKYNVLKYNIIRIEWTITNPEISEVLYCILFYNFNYRTKLI